MEKNPRPYLVFSPPLAVYLHWPFCRKICPYCHFNRFLHGPLDEKRWYETFCKELEFWKKKTPYHHIVSIFWGGGTPSLMNPEFCGKILDKIKELWTLDSKIEITLEMNPNEHEKLLDFHQAGINRFSLGVQSFQEESLKILGRDHHGTLLKKALETCQKSGISYSFDLIYGHEGHKNPDLWAKDLQEALPWIQHHLSLYQLSYEEQTPFYTKRHLHLSEEALLHLEDLTEKALSPLGLLPYEVSNYGHPGWESRHNLSYWRYEDFIGLGPGAHGRLMKIDNETTTQWAFVNKKRPDLWMESIDLHGHGLEEETCLSEETAIYEHLLMSLRLTEGVSLREVFYRHGDHKNSIGRNIPEDFLSKLKNCENHNLLKIEENHVYLTKKGRNVLNEIMHFLMKKTP